MFRTDEGLELEEYLRRYNLFRGVREQGADYNGNWASDLELTRRMRVNFNQYYSIGRGYRYGRNESIDRGDQRRRNEGFIGMGQHGRNGRTGRSNRDVGNAICDRIERNESNDKSDDVGKKVTRQSSRPDILAQAVPFPKCESQIPMELPAKVATETERPNCDLSESPPEATNIVSGVKINYSEPPDARIPKRRWRLYPFKNEQILPTLYVHRQSVYLIGRDTRVANIVVNNPSCSKQHAALQYRLVSFQRKGGGEGRCVKPYLIDLGSRNGTTVNNVKLVPRQFHELREHDVLMFGTSPREYVLLHEHNSDAELDDDVPVQSTTEI